MKAASTKQGEWRPKFLPGNHTLQLSFKLQSFELCLWAFVFYLHLFWASVNKMCPRYQQSLRELVRVLTTLKRKTALNFEPGNTPKCFHINEWKLLHPFTALWLTRSPRSTVLSDSGAGKTRMSEWVERSHSQLLIQHSGPTYIAGRVTPQPLFTALLIAPACDWKSVSLEDSKCPASTCAAVPPPAL